MALCSGANSSHLHKMQMIRSFALKWCKHVTPSYIRLNILNINDIAKLEPAKFLHKFANQSLPKYFLTLTGFRRHMIIVQGITVEDEVAGDATASSIIWAKFGWMLKFRTSVYYACFIYSSADFAR